MFHTTVNLVDYLWLIMVGAFIARMIVPFGSKFRRDYMTCVIPVSEKEKQQYDSFRSHSITLASFTMTVIAIIIAFPKQEQFSANLMSLVYLSVALVSFFIASYLYVFRTNRWFPYIGESLEYMGIIAVGIGLLSLMENVAQSNIADNTSVNSIILINIVYAIFLIGMIAIAYKEISLTKTFFHQPV